MKKLFALVGAIIIALSLCACGGTGTCEGCGKEGSVEKYTYEGQSAYLCDDCGALVEFAKALE